MSKTLGEKMSDILFRTEDHIFSYRVAGICVKDNKVLLQKPNNDTEFAFPGGHVAFGETNAETLEREFREEIGADIEVKELKWVAEIFFPWGDKPCHQICLYYMIYIVSDNLPTSDIFIGTESLENKEFKLEFHWIPIENIKDIELYPLEAKDLLTDLDSGVEHFVYRE